MTRVIKGAALADFVAEWTNALEPEAGESQSLSPGDEAPDSWVMSLLRCAALLLAG